MAEMVRSGDEATLKAMILWICPLLERYLALEYELRNITVKSYDLTDKIVDARVRYKEDGDSMIDGEQSFSARYPSATHLIGVEPDIPAIFLDLHEREELGATDLDVVKVRRDLLDLFLKEIREFGIVLFVSLFAIYQIVPYEWLSGLLGVSMKAAKLWTVAASLVISLSIAMLNIRSKCR